MRQQLVIDCRLVFSPSGDEEGPGRSHGLFCQYLDKRFAIPRGSHGMAAARCAAGRQSAGAGAWRGIAGAFRLAPGGQAVEVHLRPLAIAGSSPRSGPCRSGRKRPDDGLCRQWLARSGHRHRSPHGAGRQMDPGAEHAPGTSCPAWPFPGPVSDGRPAGEHRAIWPAPCQQHAAAQPAHHRAKETRCGGHAGHGVDGRHRRTSHRPAGWRPLQPDRLRPCGRGTPAARGPGLRCCEEGHTAGGDVAPNAPRGHRSAAPGPAGTAPTFPIRGRPRGQSLSGAAGAQRRLHRHQ